MFPKKHILAAAAILALGAGALALAAGPTLDDMKALVYVLAQGAKAVVQLGVDMAAFKQHSRNCVVITNQSGQPWRFGYLGNAKSELNGKQSGTFTLETVTRDLKTYKSLGALAPDGAPAVIPSGYDSLILKPVFEKSGYVSWYDFFRVCYVEDLRGNRIYLNLTAPGTLTASVPEVGLAAASQKDVMQDVAGKEKVLQLWAPYAIDVDDLKTMSVIAIGRNYLK